MAEKKADGVRIPVGLDTQAVVEGLKEIESAIKGSATQWNAIAELAGKTWSVVSAPFAFAADALSSFVAAASEAEGAERRAFVALQTRTRFTSEAFEALKRFNSALQQKAALDADSLLEVQGTLAALGVLPSRMREATEATVGLAEATGRTLNYAAQKVAKDLAKGGDSVALWSRSVALAEDRARSLTGQMSLLAINVGELQDTLGANVTQSGALSEGLQAINRAAVRLTEYLDSDAGKLAVDRFFRVLAAGAANTIDAFIGMIRLARDLRTEIGIAWANLKADIAGDDTWSMPIEETGSALEQLLQQATDLSDELRQISRQSASLLAGPSAAGSGGGIGGVGGRGKIGKRISIHAEDDPFGLDADATRARQLEDLAQAEADARQKFAETQADADRQIKEAEFQSQIAHHQRMLESKRAFFGELLSAGAAGFAGFFGAIGSQLASGQVDIEGALGQLLSTIGQQLGQFLIAAGGAAVAGGILGTAVPLFGAILGGPQAVAAGAGLIAAGGLLTGLSSALGGGGGGGRSAGPGAGRAASSRDPSRFVDLARWTGNAERLAGAGAPAGFAQGPTTIQRVFHVHFGSGVVVARSELEGARTIRRMLDQLERNSGGGRGGR